MKKNLISCFLMGCMLAFNANAYTTTESETLNVWYELPTFIADGETVNYIKVYENDGDNVYSAFNMHFVFPEGLRVNRIKKGREEVYDITLSERASSTHTIACNMPEATMLKIICTSTVNDNLFNTDLNEQPLDLLFTVGLIADPSMEPGSYEIYLDGIKFVFKTGDASVPANEPIYSTMLVEPDPTAVESVSIDHNVPIEYYDLQGHRVNPSLMHGKIVISKGNKVLVK